MLRRMRFASIPAACALALVFLAAGCGGSGRLSASDYRAKLAALGKEAAKAQGEVEKALNAKTVAEIRRRLNTFATSEDRLGDEVSKLKSPKNGEAANAELARGEHDLAAQARAVLPKLATSTSPKAAVSFLNSQLGQAKGAHEIDEGLALLKKLGYTKGS
jgi:hypothetical protein